MPSAKLKRTWFSPAGRRYRAERGRVDISTDQIKDLPSDAEVYSDEGELLGVAGEIRDVKFSGAKEPSADKKLADAAAAAKKEADEKEAAENQAADDKIAADKAAAARVGGTNSPAKPAGLDLTRK